MQEKLEKTIFRNKVSSWSVTHPILYVKYVITNERSHKNVALLTCILKPFRTETALKEKHEENGFIFSFALFFKAI